VSLADPAINTGQADIVGFGVSGVFVLQSRLV
jgi:hypothetical protein